MEINCFLETLKIVIDIKITVTTDIKAKSTLEC